MLLPSSLPGFHGFKVLHRFERRCQRRVLLFFLVGESVVLLALTLLIGAN